MRPRARSSRTARACTSPPRRRMATSSSASTGCHAGRRRLGRLPSQLSAGPALDPANPREVKNGADKGSGGLWNNNPDNPGRWPLVKADNPIGEWNALAIKMVGTRVWVTLNGKPVVVGQVLDNFFDRTQPVLPSGHRTADAWIGGTLPQHLRSRDPRGGRKGAAGDYPRGEVRAASGLSPATARTSSSATSASHPGSLRGNSTRGVTSAGPEVLAQGRNCRDLRHPHCTVH